jgi:prepilin-type N-terminal cleavage/methylation domain-containing protein
VACEISLSWSYHCFWVRAFPIVVASQKSPQNQVDRTAKMMARVRVADARGFTLIEIMASLVIIGVLASVGVQKHDALSASASQRALEYATRELNSKELLTWALVKFSAEGWKSDEALFAELDTQIGEGFSWASGPGVTGGALRMQSLTLSLIRTPSTINSAARWKPS